MEKVELVKMSPKGQLVVPIEIRQKQDFKPSDRFIPFSVKGGVLFKKIKLPDAEMEFMSLSQEIEKELKRRLK